MTGSDWALMRRFMDLERELDDAFDSLIDGPWGRGERAEWNPAVDIEDTGDAYLVTVDVPGICGDQIELRLGPREIRIRGQRSSSRSVATATHIHRERVTGQFVRTFRLAEPIDTGSAKCQCENGVYQVRVRKLRAGGAIASREETPR